ncbi:MAG: elongation factor P [Planctomycetota bacterium]|nr:elongation factor P [Planctomycetota bacterium]
MAQVKANDIRRGMVVIIDGVNFVVMDFLHHTPGNLRAMVQTKLKSLKNGSTIEKRFRSADTLEVPYVETKEFQYLYSQGDDHVFMDMETYDQFPLNTDILGTSLKFVVPNTKVMVKYIDDKPVSVEIPSSMDYTITDTAPELKGATATNQYKEAICENGLVIQVPPFMKVGDKVKVDTRTGEYLERVK